MLARRRAATAEDAREIARRELIVAKRAHDLQAGRVAQHIENAAHSPLRERRQLGALGGGDRRGIYGLLKGWFQGRTSS